VSLFGGVRVLDLSHMPAGPYGSLPLADMGAEVVKVERAPRRGERTDEVLTDLPALPAEGLARRRARGVVR
jgi:crotonobetainyl-CoA:carnitine CoA-transferase CaiB-like acyl-CoA transferase